MVLYIILCKLISKFKPKEASSSKGGLLLAEAREALRIDVNKTRCKCEPSTQFFHTLIHRPQGSVLDYCLLLGKCLTFWCLKV